MATNPYVNNYSQANDQSLIDSLTIESIQLWGFDVVYAPRQLMKLDQLYREDQLSKFITGVTIEMYVASTTGFEGNGDLLSKFGLEIQDQVTLEVSRTRFGQTVTNTHATITRPREGDLIYMPAPFNKLWEIKFVEHEDPFYQAGLLTKYKIKAEKFRYSHERLETGVANIDAIADQYAYALALTLGTGSGTFANNEIVYQGTWPNAADATGYVVSWNTGNQTLTLRQITGTFTTDQNVTGVTSGASYTLVSAPDPKANVNDALQDNTYIEDQVSDILNFSEDNPFGE